LLTGLTTCLFYHGPDNPVLQPVSTQFPQVQDNNNNNWLTHSVTTTEGKKPKDVVQTPLQEMDNRLTKTHTHGSGNTIFRMRDKESTQRSNTDSTVQTEGVSASQENITGFGFQSCVRHMQRSRIPQFQTDDDKNGGRTPNSADFSF
jgi:hypothetical protein